MRDLARSRRIGYDHSFKAINQSGGGRMNLESMKGHPDMDYPQHQRTYNGFIRLIQISVVFLVLLLAGMAIFLT